MILGVRDVEISTLIRGDTAWFVKKCVVSRDPLSCVIFFDTSVKVRNGLTERSTLAIACDCVNTKARHILSYRERLFAVAVGDMCDRSDDVVLRIRNEDRRLKSVGVFALHADIICFGGEEGERGWVIEERDIGGTITEPRETCSCEVEAVVEGVLCALCFVHPDFVMPCIRKIDRMDLFILCACVRVDGDTCWGLDTVRCPSVELFRLLGIGLIKTNLVVARVGNEEIAFCIGREPIRVKEACEIFGSILETYAPAYTREGVVIIALRTSCQT